MKLSSECAREGEDNPEFGPDGFASAIPGVEHAPTYDAENGFAGYADLYETGYADANEVNRG